MKTINLMFWCVVGAIGVTFGASVYTAVQHKKDTEVQDTTTIAVPATLPTN